MRGWLSDLYFGSLMPRSAGAPAPTEEPGSAGTQEEAVDQLVKRLGNRATIDDPIFGRTSGMPTLQRYAEEVTAWLRKHEGTFEKTAFVTGSDRDVTEGMLALTFDGRRVHVPVAVVAERRPEREVELRLYYSTKPIKGTRAVRSPLLPQDDEVAVPPPVAAHLEALSRGDEKGIIASFEATGTLRDSAGTTYAKDGEGGPLLAYYEKLFAAGNTASTPSLPQRGERELRNGDPQGSPRRRRDHVCARVHRGPRPRKDRRSAGRHRRLRARNERASAVGARLPGRRGVSE